ncbi:hypothetical protein ACQ859_03905 [Roseateles chitinivorans]|uniref:hypothetical protein n=1 Tax=Roseateles chitinivorans TaxID=2917965 RepID=UPI003D674CA6
MKKILLLAAILLAAPLAQADYKPIVQDRYYTATVAVNGGSASYRQPWLVGNGLSSVANDIVTLPASLQSGINAELDKLLKEKYGGFLINGTLTGPFNLHLYPNAGYVLSDLTGPTYVGVGRATRKEFGVTITCQVTVTLRDILIRAQFGSDGSGTPNERLGITATTSSTSICDNSLGWVPFLGDLLNSVIEGKINDAVGSGVKQFTNDVASKFFFLRDVNFQNGFDRLLANVPNPTRPDGTVIFPLREFVRDNVAYLLTGADMTLSLGTWAPVNVKPGVGEPHETVLVGTLLSWSVSSQAVNFSASLTDTAVVRWQYICPNNRPICSAP